MASKKRKTRSSPPAPIPPARRTAREPPSSAKFRASAAASTHARTIPYLLHNAPPHQQNPTLYDILARRFTTRGWSRPDYVDQHGRLKSSKTKTTQTWGEVFERKAMEHLDGGGDEGGDVLVNLQRRARMAMMREGWRDKKGEGGEVPDGDLVGGVLEGASNWAWMKGVEEEMRGGLDASALLAIGVLMEEQMKETLGDGKALEELGEYFSDSDDDDEDSNFKKQKVVTDLDDDNEDQQDDEEEEAAEEVGEEDEGEEEEEPNNVLLHDGFNEPGAVVVG